MVKLTEDMIVARTRVSDMSNVKKLNCWGAELTDVSVLRSLSNVEVLSLSVNCITTLADIQHCKNLQELYIRKNQIQDLSEICWLRNLTKLKNLWLEENPCAQGGELYRMSVIKNLPQLQKLDNTVVQPDEVGEAMRRGIELVHPHDRPPTGPPDHDGYYAAAPAPTSYQAGYGSRRSSQIASAYSSGAGAMEDGYAVPEYHTGRRYSHQDQQQQPTSNGMSSSSRRSSRAVSMTHGMDESMRRMSVHNEYEDSPYDSAAAAGNSGRQHHSNSISGPISTENYASSYSVQYVTNGSSNESMQQHQHSTESERRMIAQHYDQTYEQVSTQIESAQQLVEDRKYSTGNSRPSPERPYPRRPKNRNSNILSAVLCLIKELDGPSLEVAEMAVRCRMEELED